MAKSITQIAIFRKDDSENLQDLERLKMLLEYIPDQEFLRKLRKHRGNGRNDYPGYIMWNSILAGILYQHESIEKLRRELSRNSDLRRICGFHEGKAVPGKDVFSRFLKLLIRYKEDIRSNIFDRLVDQVTEELPDFGKYLAIDSKAISSCARRANKKQKADGRRDKDADLGCKTYRGIDQDGQPWETIKSWFGYKLHLAVETHYELPVGFMITKASASDMPIAHKLVEDIADRHPGLLNASAQPARCEELSADKGYDDSKLIVKLWEDYHVKPVIDIRNMWKDNEETHALTGKEHVVYDYQGNVYCYASNGERRLMGNGGLDASRNTLRKLCPVQAKGFSCPDCQICQWKEGLRIKLEEEPRIFTPIDRTSYKWQRSYARRTAVERVNSRIDQGYEFENHFIRGQAKMETRCLLAFMVMLTLAYARIKEHRLKDMRRLVVA